MFNSCLQIIDSTFASTFEDISNKSLYKVSKFHFLFLKIHKQVLVQC